MALQISKLSDTTDLKKTSESNESIKPAQFMSKTELTIGLLNPTKDGGDIVYQFKLQPGDA